MSYLFQSYAGKYIPAIAHRIHTQNPKVINNFKGVAIGDGFTDPPTVGQHLSCYPNKNDFISLYGKIVSPAVGSNLTYCTVINGVL